MFGLPYEFPYDVGTYKEHQSLNYRNDIPNPRWTLANSSDDETVRRVFGNFTTNYEINSWSNVSYRLSFDNYTQRKKFYINKGNDASGTPVFEEMAAAYGIADTTHSSNAQFLDYDNDGDPDLFIATNYMNRRNPSQYVKKVTDGTEINRDRLFLHHLAKRLE